MAPKMSDGIKGLKHFHISKLTQDDDEDGRVHVVITKKVQVIFGLNLSIGSEPDEDCADQCEDDVADDHEVLHEALAASLHLAKLCLWLWMECIR